jgi:hypothetical protein
MDQVENGSDRATLGPGTDAPAAVQAKLTYLGFLQDTAARAAQTTARLFLLRLLLMVLILALLVDFADAKDEVELPLLDLTVDQLRLLEGACVLSFVVIVFDIAYFARGHMLGLRAAALHRELGYEAPQKEWGSPRSPFGLEYARAPAADPLFGRRMTYERVAIGGTALAGVILVVAQFWVLVELWTSGEEVGRAEAIAFALVPIATALVGIRRIRVYRKNPLMGLGGAWSGRDTRTIRFPRIGDVFPAADPVARFVTVVAMMSNDWVRLMDDMLALDDHAPDATARRIMSFRQQAALHYEAAQFIADARRRFPQVDAFIQTLEPDARDDCDRITGGIDPTSPHYHGRWLTDHRNVTFHSPKMHPDKAAHGKEEISEALKAAAGLEGTITSGRGLGSVRFGFADQVAVQWLPDGENEVHLIVTLRDSVMALARFTQRAVDAYLTSRPDGAFTVEGDPGSDTRGQ